MKTKFNWPDPVREGMIEKSLFYESEREYQYGYFDGWQRNTPELLEALKESRDFMKNLHEKTSWVPKELAIRIDQAIKKAEG